MSISEIELICGQTPVGFKKEMITGSNHIFEVDPNFIPLNLYNFWGNAATVNSFSECLHYVEGGFKPSVTTIFDVLVIFSITLIGLFSLYKLIRIKFHNKLISKSKIAINKLKNYNFSKKLRFTIFPLFLIQNYFLFDYIRTKSVRIPPFIDEYISITANLNFFKNLSFISAGFLGGNYNVNLTSGPISAVGSVIAWNITDKLIISRISNFFWVYLLQIIFICLIAKLYKSDFKFLFFISSLLLVLIPWWQGSLYSLGEIPSLIVFANAIFLFPKLRGVSMILFSISIFYGKLLNLVPFAGFYIAIMLYEKKIKNIIKDFKFFIIPLSTWLLLVNFKYEEGNAFKYIIDQFYFITNHQSSGAPGGGQNFIDSLLNSFIYSEFSSWNSLDKIRLIIVPIIFLIILFRNNELIDTFFGKITMPIISSVLFSYIWFWLFNTTKWMRHTQHFIILLLLCIIYLINFNIINSNIDLSILILLIGIFIENNKYLFILLAVFTLFIVYNIKDYLKYSYIKVVLILILVIDISIPYFEKDTFGNLHNIIDSCKADLISDECLKDYESK